MNNGNVAAARRRVLLASAIGTVAEWYDFLLYGFFATTIAVVFFPKSNPTAALLSTFVIFGVGFLARPLGGVVFGHLSDRIGRRPALLIAVMLMTASTVAVGLLPSYAQIGAAAPLLLLVCRLVQGFSAAGEASSAAVFVIEHAQPERRGRYASVIPVAITISTGLGALISLVVTSTTTQEQLVSWGWRVPFISAAPLALIGLYLRLRVEESPVFSALRAAGELESSPVVRAVKHTKKPMIVLICWMMSNAVASYIITSYLVSYLTGTVKFSNGQSLVVELVANVVFIVACILTGRALEVVGAKRIAVGSALGLGVWAIPAFVLLEHSSLLGASLIIGVLAVFWSVISTTSYLALVELFPAGVRTTASGLAYNVSYALFGGSAPYVAAWLVGRGYLVGPGYYLAGLCAVSALAAAIGIGNWTPSNRGHDVIQATDEGAQQLNS